MSGKRDSGLYRDDPLLGRVVTVTRSRTWTVGDALKIDRISVTGSNVLEIQFTAQANHGYTIEDRDSLSEGSWQPLIHLDPTPATRTVTVPLAYSAATPTRFLSDRNALEPVWWNEAQP